MELSFVVTVSSAIVSLLSCDFVDTSRHQRTTQMKKYGRKLDDAEYFADNGQFTADSEQKEPDNYGVIGAHSIYHEDAPEWNVPGGTVSDNQAFIKANEKRGRRHRDIHYIKSVPQDLKAQLKALSREGPGDSQKVPKDMISVYKAMLNEIESKEELKKRLDDLEVQMNKLSDVTRHLSVNATGDKHIGCYCADVIKREELESVKVHLRRMYLMLNAQEERHRDMLDLVKAYRSMVFNSADVIGQLEDKLEKIQSNLRRQRIQMDKLNLDMHWRHVQQDVTANDTKHLGQVVGQLQTTIKGLYADHGHFYTTLDHLTITVNTSKLTANQLQDDSKSLRLVLKRLLQSMVHNKTTDSGRESVIAELLRNISVDTTRRPGAPNHLTTECNGPWCIQDNYDLIPGLQRQLDQTSLNVEQLKDEMGQFYNFLQSVQANIRHVRGQQDEEAIREMEVRRLKTEILHLRRNITRIESVLGRSEEGITDYDTEAVELLSELDGSSDFTPHRATPTVRSSARKAAHSLPYKSSEQSETDDVTTFESQETEDYDVIADTPPTVWTRPEDEIEQNEAELESLNQKTEKPSEYSEDHDNPKSKISDKSSQNDVIYGSKSPSTEPYNTRRSTVKIDPNSIVTMETLSSATTTPSPYFGKMGHGHKSGLKVKPSESDVCALPGIMIGHSKPIAKFADALTGSWMRDPESRNNHIYVTTGHNKIKLLKEYNTTEDLIAKNKWRDFKLPITCTGTGHVMFNGSLYCNKYKSNRIVKYNTKDNQSLTHTIKTAGHANEFPYTGGENTDIDFGVDELGLWVIYSGTAHHGNIVIGKVNPETLEIYPTWNTTFPKKRAVNCFMVCGRLYVVSYNSEGDLQLSYVYDTLRGREIPPSHQAFYSVSDSVSMMAYNPKDSKLYAWVRTPQWQGQLLQYSILFIG